MAILLGLKEMENKETTSSRDSDRPEASEDFERKKVQRSRFKKRILDTRNLNLNYKDSETLERFISKTGKILPRRMTGANAKIQRKIAREIKRSRMIQLVPFSRR
ncbi:MAG: 30S ribosomal protein S18 [Spirochaetia bacterium]|nr:30S ribosomal protein S18 [Spirochaetia bacterium]